MVTWPRHRIVWRSQRDIALQPTNMYWIPMSPRNPCAREGWEIRRFRLEVKQCACIDAVGERSDIGDDLHVPDIASLAGVGVAENFEGEGILGDLQTICDGGLVGGSVRGAVGGGTA